MFHSLAAGFPILLSDPLTHILPLVPAVSQTLQLVGEIKEVSTCSPFHPPLAGVWFDSRSPRENNRATRPGEDEAGKCLMKLCYDFRHGFASQSLCSLPPTCSIGNLDVLLPYLKLGEGTSKGGPVALHRTSRHFCTRCVLRRCSPAEGGSPDGHDGPAAGGGSELVQEDR